MNRDRRDGWEPTTDLFPQVKVEQLRRELIDKAAEAAKSSTNPKLIAENVEAAVKADIEQRLIRARDDHDRALESYDLRLGATAFDGVARVQIEAAAAAAKGDFIAQAERDRLPIGVPEERLRRLDDELARFEERHRLENVSPLIVSGTTMLVAVAVIAIVWLAETSLNAFFFAEGSELGLLGGFVEAAALSLVNVLLAFALAYFVVPYRKHRMLVPRLVGLIGLGVGLLLVLAMNLVVAHYREAFVIAAGGEVDFRDVLKRITADPIHLTSLRSWLLGVLGLFAAFITMWKVSSMRDPYPGYGAIARRRYAAQVELEVVRHAALDDLEQLRDDALGRMNDIVRGLENKKADFELAVRGRERMHRAYSSHCVQLQSVETQLLQEFAHRAGLPIPVVPPNPFSIEALPALSVRLDEHAFAGAVNAMSEAIREIEAAYENVVRRVTGDPQRLGSE